MKYYLKLKEHRPVLTAHDAYEVLISLNNPELENANLRTPSLLMTDDTNYFWVATNQRELFAVKIGMKCEVLHAPHGSSGLYKVKDGTVKIVLKDCSAETDENTKLYVECEYNAAYYRDFKIKGLFVEGCQIVDFPHTYWKAECLRADNTIDDGCCGDLQWWYKLADNTISKTYHHDAIGRVAVWNGFKCIREYRDGDKPTIESMMRVWRAILSEYGTKYRDWTPLGDML